MRKNTKKAFCILFAVLLLACSFPISVFAVDPVSASVIANSFAQAITAYGASHGVSLTFDGITSGNTDQIGQSVHELWSRFRAGQQTADDYDTIAAAVFPGLYNKVIKAGGTAVVGMSIAQEYMPDIDGFWNWLLSGPAEMVKVDNAYQWNADPVTGSISPVTVNSIDAYFMNGVPIYELPIIYVVNGTNRAGFVPNDDDVFLLVGYNPNNNNMADLFLCAFHSFTYTWYSYGSAFSGQGNSTESTTDGHTLYFSRNHWTYDPNWMPVSTSNMGSKPSDLVGPISLGDSVSSDSSSVSVAPYIGDAVAKPVPLPDVGDPDYGPVPWAGDLDVPWNDTLFGDGTGTLTDAQKGAITEELDGVIENDGTLTLEGDKTAPGPDEDEDDPPSDDPDDYGVIGLENIFPFCIPFDIYNFLDALAANPTAPHFTATLQLPSALGGAQTIDLDFDNPTFNQLAQLLRLLELLAFIVGLALLTRSMFIRG